MIVMPPMSRNNFLQIKFCTLNGNAHLIICRTNIWERCKLDMTCTYLHPQKPQDQLWSHEVLPTVWEEGYPCLYDHGKGRKPGRQVFERHSTHPPKSLRPARWGRHTGHCLAPHPPIQVTCPQFMYRAYVSLHSSC